MVLMNELASIRKSVKKRWKSEHPMPDLVLCIDVAQEPPTRDESDQVATSDQLLTISSTSIWNGASMFWSFFDGYEERVKFFGH